MPHIRMRAVQGLVDGARSDLVDTQCLSERDTMTDNGLVARIKFSQDVCVAHYQYMRQRKIIYLTCIHRWFKGGLFIVEFGRWFAAENAMLKTFVDTFAEPII